MAWSGNEKPGCADGERKLYHALLDDALDQPVRNASAREDRASGRNSLGDVPAGLAKHLLNEQMNTRMENGGRLLQNRSTGSRSGKHRHLAEECLYVVEGRGYDCTRICDVEITDTYHWSPGGAEALEWEAGDVIYIPPTRSTSISRGSTAPRRLISATTHLQILRIERPRAIEDAPSTTPRSCSTRISSSNTSRGR